MAVFFAGAKFTTILKVAYFKKIKGVRLSYDNQAKLVKIIYNKIMRNPAETGRGDLPEQKTEREQTLEAILDALELAFEKGAKTELTVLEPSGALKTNAVFIEGFEDGTLFVAESKSSPVMGIKIDDVKKVSG